MKKQIPLFLTLFLLSIVSPSAAQEKENKYALLVSGEDHIRVAIKTASELFDNKKYNAAAFEVIICGKAVEIFKDSLGTKLAEEAKKAGIVLKACGISLEKFKIDAGSVPRSVEVVPNGLLRIFDLQKEKYNTIEL